MRTDVIDKRWHSVYANYDGGEWCVYDKVPERCPERAKLFGMAKGSAAFGPVCQVDWLIYCANDRFSPDKGSLIYLYNRETGYAARKRGSARVP